MSSRFIKSLQIRLVRVQPTYIKYNILKKKKNNRIHTFHTIVQHTHTHIHRHILGIIVPYVGRHQRVIIVLYELMHSVSGCISDGQRSLCIA